MSPVLGTLIAAPADPLLDAANGGDGAWGPARPGYGPVPEPWPSDAHVAEARRLMPRQVAVDCGVPVMDDREAEVRIAAALAVRDAEIARLSAVEKAARDLCDLVATRDPDWTSGLERALMAACGVGFRKGEPTRTAEQALAEMQVDLQRAEQRAAEAEARLVAAEADLRGRAAKWEGLRDDTDYGAQPFACERYDASAAALTEAADAIASGPAHDALARHDAAVRAEEEDRHLRADAGLRALYAARLGIEPRSCWDDVVDAVRAKALEEAARLIEGPCGDEQHDDRWCPTCSHNESDAALVRSLLTPAPTGADPLADAAGNRRHKDGSRCVDPACHRAHALPRRAKES